MSSIRVAVAGSLAAALTEYAAEFAAETGQEIELRSGPAGKLAEAILAGDPAEIYISASPRGPRNLYELGLFSTPRAIARNRLVLVVGPEVSCAASDPLEVLSEPGLRIGMSTPGADPGGDYAEAFLAKLVASDPVRWRDLRGRCSSLFGGVLPEPGRRGPSPALEALQESRADLLICYATTAQQITAAIRGARSLALPSEHAPRTEACVCYRLGSSNAVKEFENRLARGRASEILRKHGFAPV